MGRGRIEAFSDGVIAILLTIMVLELKPPRGAAFSDLGASVPTLLAYLLSFVNLGIYWNNHHHLFAGVRRVSAAALWANLHLLFWLSLIPFLTAWVGEFPRATAPTALYGVVLTLAGAAFAILHEVLRRCQPAGSPIHADPRDRVKEGLTLAIYVLGTLGSLAAAWIGQLAFVIVALMWLVPSRAVERAVFAEDGD